MAIDLGNFESKARKAVRCFWLGRVAARRKQSTSGKSDQGERAAVTGGKNMDGFVRLMQDLVHSNGLPDASLFRSRRVLTLPGFFRPTKLWDLLVIHGGQLVAALEFKSHVGPSFGNNFNNRTEEALGTATDFWTAFREGAFGTSPRPFVGWLMLVEDAVGSRSPVRDNSPHFSLLPEFRNASYAERYHQLAEKLTRENLYTAATILMSPNSAATSGRYSELGETTNLKTFVTTFAAHIAATAARSK